jgi:phosphatidylglycerophosphate synthase
MAKINPIYENPVDNFIVFELCDPISDFLNSKNIKPNMVTTIGLISSLFGAYFLYEKKIYLFMFFYLFAYYCDCLDGYIARKYRKQTKFGDYYDHVTDIIQMALIFLILIYRYNIFQYKNISIVTLIIIIVFAITQGCQEKLMGNNTSEILGITKKMCPEKFKTNISLFKLFGSGTIIFYVMFLSYYLWVKNKS